ncbi:MAG: hypothetical protein WD645_05845 [Dehalococcoidia bacterium]
MAKPKRPPFAFPELESRGRRAILRSADEVSAELDALQERIEREGDDSSSDASKDRVKVTYRFQPEAVEAVEDIRRILRREHGVRKVNREDIAQAAVLEALRDLEENGNVSFLARLFGQK